MRITAAALVAALFASDPHAAAAEDGLLTLERALALARERAPSVLSAAARIEEARGRLAGAAILLRENPVLEGGAGRRYSDAGDDTLEAEVAVRQGFELGGQRGARVAGAEAGIARAGAARDDAVRRLLGEVALAFQRALHAGQRLRLAETAEGMSAEVARIAERRHRAEDVPILDVNVSRAELARARAESRDAEAARAIALGELRLLLGMEAAETLEPSGELRDRRRFDLADLQVQARERADLRALEAQVDEAEAELRLARGAAWPEFGLGARYARDERDDVVLGELSLGLPLFDRAQGRRAVASARVRRLRAELDAARRAAGVEVQTAFAVHAARAKAVDELEAGALPLLDENEALTRRSYEAGEMALAELLLVRRETLEIRREHLERLLEAAAAAVGLQTSAGVLR